MTQPPLYKYLDVRGAKLTLGNRAFRHAKPSDFNDIEDLTIQSIFPEDVEAALPNLSNGFTDVIVKNVNTAPTCNEQMAAKVILIQQVYRTNPGAADTVKERIKNDPNLKIFDVEHMRARSKVHIDEINQFMQDFRVLCVTAHRDSERMWTGYAENHQGIALRITPNVAKDSKFQRFRCVEYHASRPPLYDDTLGFLEGSLFGDPASRISLILDLPWAIPPGHRPARSSLRCCSAKVSG
jgi:hypothetical protein